MQQQWINGKGETFYGNPGQQLPYGSTWQQVGGCSNPMGGGAHIPTPPSYSPPAQSSSTPLWTTPTATSSYPPSTSSTSYSYAGTYSGSAWSGFNFSLPPLLNAYQRRMAAIGFLIGFVIAYIPFLLRGLGSDSDYPFIVSAQVGYCLASAFCAFALVRKAGDRHPFKALVVVALCYFVMTHLARYVPFERLYSSLL